jgi:hypothetical protein
MRKGVLSDTSIKEQYPEYFPLDIGLQQAMYAPSIVVPKMNKSTKKVKHATDYARFPLYDIKNFARLTTPQYAIQAGFEGVLKYRSKIGSQNVPADLDDGYANQKEQTYTMRVPKHIDTFKKINESVLMTTSGTLSLGKRTNIRNNKDEFNQKFPNESIYFQDKTKELLMNLGDDADVQRLLESTFPPPLRGSKYNHNEALGILRDAYKNSPADLQVLTAAERASRVEDRLPDSNTFGGMIVDAFGRFFPSPEPTQQITNVDERM